MTLNYSCDVSPISQDDFKALDYEVMGAAFDIHNKYGRFCHESVYRNALVNACRAIGLRASTEVEIRLSCRGFSKSYFIDLLVEGGAVYELKTVRHLMAEHRAQTLTYLLLASLQHGKLVNMGAPSVSAEYVDTSFDNGQRRAFQIEAISLDSSDELGQRVLQSLEEVLWEFGICLGTELYRDAIVHLVTGSASEPTYLEITDGQQMIGHQPFYLVSPDAAVVVSATTETANFTKHLNRLLAHTALSRCFWVNLEKHRITLTGVTKR